MILSVGSDHAGFRLKDTVLAAIEKLGHEYIFRGCFDENPVDFPDICRIVCQDVLDGRAEKGVMVCGSGVGAAIASNKIPGIRASVCHDIYSARQCVEHDHVNVICLGASIIGPIIAEEMLAAFLNAKPSMEEHFLRRVKKLGDMDKEFKPVSAQ